VADARARACGNPADHAAFPCCVPPLEDHDNACARGLGPSLPSRKLIGASRAPFQVPCAAFCRIRPLAQLRHASVVCLFPSGKAPAPIRLVRRHPLYKHASPNQRDLIDINQADARQRAVILPEDRRDCPDEIPCGASILTSRCSACPCRAAEDKFVAGLAVWSRCQDIAEEPCGSARSKLQ
jgi:hypothetical protein